MDWPNADSTAVTSGRPGRFGPPPTHRPPAGQPVTSGHPPLAALLSALAAPGSEQELAGERAAVAGFVRSQQDPAPTAMPVSSRLRRPRRILGVLAAGLVVAIGGGRAAAANGALPHGLQQGAHRLLSPLGVPGPTASPPRPATTSRTGTERSATPRTRPSDPGGTPARQLCQARVTEQKDPHGGH